MNKSDMIISVIIVLCIAAGVVAYGLTNNDNPIFSDLSSLGSGDSGNGDGIGNNTTTGTGVGTGTGTSSGSGTGSSSGSGSGSSSGGSSGGSGSSSGGSSSGSGDSSSITRSQAISIANANIAQDGWHASSAYYSNGFWIVKIVDSDGNHVDQMAISRTGNIIDR